MNFTNAIAIDPQDSLAYGGRGEAYVHKGDYRRAAMDFTAAIEIDPSAPRAYVNRGACRFALKKKDDRAIDDFSKAIALDPACDSAYFHRGLAWNSRNRHKQAIADFTEVIRLNPKHLEAYRNRAIAHAGRSTRCAEAEQAPEFKRAIADLAAALRLAPKDPSLFITRARIWFREPWTKLPKHALDHAIDDFFKAIALGSHEPSNYTGRADARRWKVQNYINDPAAAIAEYTLAIAELEGAASRFATNTLPRQTLTSLYLSRGAAYHHARDYERAIADLTAAIEFQLNSPAVYQDEGHTCQCIAGGASSYLGKGDLDPAIADFTKAIAIAAAGGAENRRLLAYLIRRRARAFQKNGDHVRAAAEFSSLIKGNDWQALDYIERGCAFLGIGNSDSAIADFTKAMEIHTANDNHPSLLTRLEHPHLRGDYNHTADIDKTIALEPDINPTAYVHRANAWLTKQDTKRAIADFTKAIALSPNSAPAYSGRAQAWLVSRDHDRAIMDFTKAARLNPSDPFTQKELAEALRATHTRAAKMKTTEILQSLTRLDRVTPTALAAASSQRSKMLPLFLKEIALWLDVAGDMADRGQVHTNDITAIFCLLGEWQEKSAYQPLIRVLQGDMPEGGLCDLADGYHAVLAAVYDGNPRPLFGLALDPWAAQNPRIQAFLAAGTLTARNQISRHHAKLFFRDAFEQFETRYQHAKLVSAGWAKAIAIAGLRELAPMVQEACAGGLVHGLTFQQFQDILTRAVAQPWNMLKEYGQPINSIETFSKWIWR